MKEQFINIDRLRRDLKDYYGIAMVNASPMALLNVAKVERASAEELVKLAQKLRIDLDKCFV